jgi:hypothetical protein
MAGHLTGHTAGDPDDTEPTLDLVVDVANVMGSRPDGWWRDRAGAAERLVRSLAPLTGAVVAGPDGGTVQVTAVHAVVEGQARGVPEVADVVLVRAPADGDTSVVVTCRSLLATGGHPLAVTADRGLRDRLPAGTAVTGPRWLLDLLPPPGPSSGAPRRNRS